MSYIEDALEEVKRVTPISGVNVCIFDDFEEVGNKLETIANFDTVEEAQDFIDNYEDEEVELVMYEAEESTEYNTKYPSFSTQKNHNVDNYIDMAQNDYEKGVNRDNDEYENTNYRKTTEKLNKDGTGVKRATRGVNPKKTKAKVLQFVYVSKSECEICRQYDGMAFATDSPNRPIIPRLESQGKKGTRPYTHPNCRCKWVRPFSDAGIKNFDDMGLFNDGNKSLGYSGEAEAHELKQKTIDSIKKEYGSLKFDKMSKEKQLDVIISSLLKKLQVESFDPTSLPIASIIKMTFDAIEPTLALQLNRMKHTHTNEVRSLIDDMVGESLTSERKHEIVLEHNLDFTLENLLDLTVTALSEALNDEKKIGMDVELEFTDDKEKAKDTVEDHLEKDPEHYSRLKSVFEHDVWDEEKNTLVDPSLLEDKEEDNEAWGNWNEEPEPMSQHDQIKMMRDLGIADKTLKDIGYDLSNEGLDDEEPYMPDVYGIDPYPHRHEFIDNVCVICNYVLKASESDSSDYYGTYNIDGGAREDNYYYLYCLHCDKKVYINYDVKGSYDEMDEHVKVHFEEEGESKASEMDDYQHQQYMEDRETDRINSIQNGISWTEARWEWDRMREQDRELVLNKLFEDEKVMNQYYKNYDYWKLPDDMREIISKKIMNDKGYFILYESKATEGGRGSGRKGHQKWMLGAEADPEECPNCMIFTEKKNGNCQICGNSY
tara:strand:+ start:940 stop:3084 length:2145 start_codon:yes stop_codon:yes gene_type:complete